MSRVEFSTKQYHRAHFRLPKGRGSWAFQLTHISLGDGVATARDLAPDEAIIWAHQATFAEAKKRAKALLVARFPGFTFAVLEVLS